MELDLNNCLNHNTTQRAVVIQPSSYKLQIAVAKAYIFLLPVRMILPLIFTQNYVGACATYFDLFLHLLGLALIVIAKRGVFQIGRDKTSKLFQYFALMFICFGISSLIMSVVMQTTYGSIGNQTAYSAVFNMNVYFTQYLIIVFYNKEIFSMLSVDDISKIFGKLMVCFLVLGYIQLAVINLGGFVGRLYNTMDIFHILRDSPLSKLPLTGSEGASGGCLIGILILPYLFSRILTAIKVLKYIIMVILWLPVIYFTNSTTAYIITTLGFIVFFLLFLLKPNKHLKLMMPVLLIVICIFIVLVFPSVASKVLPDEVGNRIEYLLVEKATDTNNGSTVSRTIPLLVNWGAFTEYPILGVGNGNQGYFYNKYFPEWARHAEGSDVMVFYEKNQTGIANGAVFLPSLLSGYGIVGVILTVGYLIKCIIIVIEKKKTLGIFYYMFFISWVAVFFSGLQGEFVGEYYIWFVLSIPYMTPNLCSDQTSDTVNPVRYDVANVNSGG